MASAAEDTPVPDRVARRSRRKMVSLVFLCMILLGLCEFVGFKAWQWAAVPRGHPAGLSPLPRLGCEGFLPRQLAAMMSAMPEHQRIAIIGCGYVGSALGEALVGAGHHVLGTTTSPAQLDALGASGIEAAVLDTADTAHLHELLRDRDAVVLCVAAGRRKGDYREVYLGSARSLISAVKGTPVKRLIYTSSVGVYGQDDGSWVDESSPVEPQNENGRILLETERTLLDGAKARGGDPPMCVSVVRLSGIYGPGRDLTSRIKNFAGRRRDDGDAYLNLIHLEDIVAALAALLGVRHHGVLNLSDDGPTTRREYYDHVIDAAGLPSIQWAGDDSPLKRGKRIRNDLIKKTLGLTLEHPTH